LSRNASPATHDTSRQEETPSVKLTQARALRGCCHLRPTHIAGLVAAAAVAPAKQVTEPTSKIAKKENNQDEPAAPGPVVAVAVVDRALALRILVADLAPVVVVAAVAAAAARYPALVVVVVAARCPVVAVVAVAAAAAAAAAADAVLAPHADAQLARVGAREPPESSPCR
jgi:hypothetical protein